MWRSSLPSMPGDIEKNKMRGDLGITYDEDVLRLIDIFRDMGLYVGSVVLTRYSGQAAADAFLHRLENLGIRCYRHYPIAGYPSDVAHIVSDEGLGKKMTTLKPATPSSWSQPRPRQRQNGHLPFPALS